MRARLRTPNPAMRIVLWVPATMLVLLLAACGGSGSGRLSASDYRAHLETVAKESNAARHAVEAGLQAKSVPQLVKVLTRFKAAEKPIGDEVAALKPPTNAETANANLAAGLRQTAAELQKSIIPRVEKMPSAQAAIAFLLGPVTTEGLRMTHGALADLKELGYIKNYSAPESYGGQA